MVSRSFINKVLGKKVHVDYEDEETGNLVFIEGVLSNISEVEDRNKEIEKFIEIESDTDFDRISERLIRKIYLK